MAKSGALPAGGIRYFRRYLLPTTEVESDFSIGMVRDRSRLEIPASGSYTLQDFFVDKPGLIYKRGGSSYQSSILTGDIDIIAVACPDFRTQPSVVAITSHDSVTSNLWDITTGTAVGPISLGQYNPVENMTAFIQEALPITSGEVRNPVLMLHNVGGTLTVDLWGGVVPHARYSCVHLNRLFLANTAEAPWRIYYSPLDGPEGVTWDTINNTMDVGEPITGMCSVNGVLLVFSRGKCWRITGTIAPGQAGADMAPEPAGNVGCIDGRTICVMNGTCYFANESGVYATSNGSAFDNLTNKSNSTGISQLWQDTLRGFSPALGAVVSAGVYQNQYLLLTVIHNDGTRSVFLYYLQGGSWVLLSPKVAATMYATSTAPTTDLYIGPADTSQWSPPRAQRLGEMWDPAPGNKNDADGTPVTPLWETRPYRPGTGLGRYLYGHLSYDLRDAASDNPGLISEVATGIEADSSYAAMAESPIGETVRSIRKRFTPFKDTQAIQFRFSQQHASAKTEIYQLELEQAAYFVADGQ